MTGRIDGRLGGEQGEWALVTEAAHNIAGALKDGVNSASALLADLMQQTSSVRQWWAARNSKPGACSAQSPAPLSQNFRDAPRSK